MQPAIFSLLSAKADYLSERQTVLTRNVANADTPGYQPRDTVSFKDALASEAMHQPGLSVATTNLMHIAASPKLAVSAADIASKRSKSYETAPSGNGVVLEEEVQKLAQTTLDHQLTTELYGKQLRLVKMALGSSGS